jgi:hypothetical protein
MEKTHKKIREVFENRRGILRMVPTFVPRRFSEAGKRIRLHPEDYYALGTARGSIKERWFSSTIPAMNGPLAPADEGMSYVAVSENSDEKILFRDFVDELGAELIGRELEETYGIWPMYSKFFDYQKPLFHHLHLYDEAAGRIGRLGKPEGYYFPPQLNNHPGEFPVSYFGFDPEVTREQVRERLLSYESGDNRITELSRAYRIEIGGGGWYTPPGVVHAPGSVLTYEPQWNSDVNSVYENIASGEIYPYDFLSENCPDEKKRDVDYILSLMDWEKNVDPYYKKTNYRPKVYCSHSDEGHQEVWVLYANDYIAAKELTIQPGREAIVSDGAAYGCILVQGHGRFGIYNDAETATMLRFGQMSGDEYFVSEAAAREGVRIVNESIWEPMVILKHFGPNHPDMPKSVPA